MSWFDKIMADYKRNQMMRNGNRSKEQFLLPSGNPEEAALAGNSAPIKQSMFGEVGGDGTILNALSNINFNDGIRKQGSGTIGPTSNKAMSNQLDIDGFSKDDIVNNIVTSTYAQRAAQNAYDKDITFNQKTGKPKVKASAPKSKKVAYVPQHVIKADTEKIARPTHTDRLAMLDNLSGGDDQYGITW